MSLGPRLEFRQTQSLVMTPQLMQAIKLLQLSNLDLVAYVEAELERNPLLERPTEPEGERTSEGDTHEGGEAGLRDPHERHDERREDFEARGGVDGSAEPHGDRDGFERDGFERDSMEREGFERDSFEREVPASDWMEQRQDTSLSAIEDRLDTNLENVFPDDNGREHAGPASGAEPSYSEWSGVGSGGSDEDGYNLEAFVSAQTTLADHLEGQLMLAIADPVERLIGQHLIDLIDEAGYLTADIAGIAERLGAPLAAIQKVLAVILPSTRRASAPAPWRNASLSS